jgi:heptosyltransferase II
MKADPKILVVQTAFIGDVILVTPVFQVLRRHWPACTVHAVVIPSGFPVLEHNPNIARIFVFDKHKQNSGISGLLQLAQQLRQERYDVVIAPHRSLRTALLARLTGASIRIGFDLNSGGRCYSHRVPYDRNQHEVDRNLSLLKPLGISGGKRPPEIYCSDEERQQISDLLTGAWAQNPLVVLAPGSVWPTKRWPEASFLELAKTMAESGFSICLIGGLQDHALCARIAALSPKQILNTAGSLSLRASAELLRHSRLLVSNDSAPLHLASATATPTLALFGPTVPEFGFAPYRDNSVVMGLDLPCRPCSIHGGRRCPIQTHACMRDLTVAAVLEKAIQLMNGTKSHG